jgi:hypothetical protein
MWEEVEHGVRIALLLGKTHLEKSTRIGFICVRYDSYSVFYWGYFCGLMRGIGRGLRSNSSSSYIEVRISSS